MSKKSVKQVRRKHSDEFRRNAISMVEDQGLYDDSGGAGAGDQPESVADMAKEIRQGSRVIGLLENEQEELDRLRKEVGRLRMERDILKKATAFFANEKN